MSDSPYIPHDSGMPVTYSAAPPFDSAPTLVKLAGIFNAITAGLNGLTGIIYIGVAIVVPIFMNAELASSPPHPGDPPPWVFGLLAGIGGGVAIVASGLSALAAVKLLKKRPNAHVWGMVAGIACCVDLWCVYGCIIPLASGIFTIVVCCQSNVKAYLASCQTPQNSAI